MAVELEGVSGMRKAAILLAIAGVAFVKRDRVVAAPW